MALTRDTVESINDLMVQFWNSDMSAAEVQKYAAREVLTKHCQSKWALSGAHVWVHFQIDKLE